MGTCRFTYDQHSVVITGYDDKYIYINDPLYSEPNRKLNRIDFEKSWEQMGSQAMTIKE